MGGNSKSPWLGVSCLGSPIWLESDIGWQKLEYWRVMEGPLGWPLTMYISFPMASPCLLCKGQFGLSLSHHMLRAFSLVTWHPKASTANIPESKAEPYYLLWPSHQVRMHHFQIILFAVPSKAHSYSREEKTSPLDGVVFLTGSNN